MIVKTQTAMILRIIFRISLNYYFFVSERNLPVLAAKATLKKRAARENVVPAQV
jgi:hypothetical protein